MSSQNTRRSLFNKPAWASSGRAAGPSQDADKSDTDFFSRGDQTFSTFLAAQEEEERQRRLARRTRNAVKSPVPDTESGKAHDVKRRRISDEASQSCQKAEKLNDDNDDQIHNNKDDSVHESDEDYSIDDECDNLKPGIDSRRDRGLPKAAAGLTTQQSGPLSKDEDTQAKSASPPVGEVSAKSTATPSQNTALVIELEDDGDKVEKVGDEATAITLLSEESDGEKNQYDSEDDEEIAREILRARENIKRRREDREGSKALQTSQTQASADASVPADEKRPVINFLVTSEIPNTHKFILQRRSNQRLKEVRLYWCRRNQIMDEELLDKIVLTWRGKRWFDSMSAEDFGLEIDKNGMAVFRDGSSSNLPEFIGDKIHLVIMTESEFERQEEQSLRKLNGETNLSDEEAEEHSDRAESQAKQEPEQIQQEDKMRLVLRAKGHDEQQVSVSSSTKIERIIQAFRVLCKVPTSKRIAMVFEGELLQPNSTVGQTDMEDMVIVDVHIK